MAALQHPVVGGQRQVVLQAQAGLALVLVEGLEQKLGVAHLEVVRGEFALVLQVHVAVGELHAVVAAGPDDVVDAVDALDVHGQALKAVCDLHGHGSALEAAHLLEVGELRDLHAVEPHLPAKAPCAERGRLPVVLDEAHVMLVRIDADGAEAPQIQVLDVVRAGLHEHLELIVVLQAVGVLAVAAVGGTAAALHVAGAPRVGAQRAQRGGRVVGASAHGAVVRLQNDAALGGPVVLQVHDDVLERGRLRAGTSRCRVRGEGFG